MEGFKKFVDSMCPQTNDNIIFGGDVVEGGRDARHKIETQDQKVTQADGKMSR